MKSIDSFTGEYEFLRNNYPCEVEVSGITYPSVDHAFQAAKTDDEDIKEEISEASAREAKRIGRGLDINSADWDSKKLNIMEILLRLKFTTQCNYDLEDKLLETGNARIRMVNENDMFWGCDLYGAGENYLGELLEKIRSELAFKAGVDLADYDDLDGENNVKRDNDDKEPIDNNKLQAQKLYYVLDSNLSTSNLDIALVGLYNAAVERTDLPEYILDNIDCEVDKIVLDNEVDFQKQLENGNYDD